VGEQVEVAVLPPCDLCGDGTPASYDTKTTVAGQAWAYLCQAHYEAHGVGRLGTGYGQRLVVKQ